MKKKKQLLLEKVKKIKLLLTDCDGVLTDTGVYYSPDGELLKRFSIRDGMGVERLRKICNIDTGIITGENSEVVAQRAKKLQIKELHLGIKDKPKLLNTILERTNLKLENIAYIGDDYNDLEVLQSIGLSAAPKDAMPEIKKQVNYICKKKGGNGAFRDFVEFIIKNKQKKQ